MTLPFTPFDELLKAVEGSTLDDEGKSWSFPLQHETFVKVYAQGRIGFQWVLMVGGFEYVTMHTFCPPSIEGLIYFFKDIRKWMTYHSCSPSHYWPQLESMVAKSLVRIAMKGRCRAFGHIERANDPGDAQFEE